MTLNAKFSYDVEIEQQEGGPEADLRERFALCASRRLERIEGEAGYPQAGQAFDILDKFEGKYVWEMTDAEFEATPPSRVDLEVVSVDPVEPPAEGAVVRVVARLVF